MILRQYVQLAGDVTYLVSVREGVRPDDALEEAGVVVPDEGVVLREDVVGPRAVQLGHQVEPDTHRVEAIVALHAGRRV